jgi:hypothetical protein
MLGSELMSSAQFKFGKQTEERFNFGLALNFVKCQTPMVQCWKMVLF